MKFLFNRWHNGLRELGFEIAKREFKFLWYHLDYWGTCIGFDIAGIRFTISYNPNSTDCEFDLKTREHRYWKQRKLYISINKKNPLRCRSYSWYFGKPTEMKHVEYKVHKEYCGVKYSITEVKYIPINDTAKAV